jgi:hypothetical protein
MREIIGELSGELNDSLFFYLLVVFNLRKMVQQE